MTEQKRLSPLYIFLISLLPFLSAGGLPLQAVCNIWAGRVLGDPLWGVSVSYLVAALLSFPLVLWTSKKNDRTLWTGFVKLGETVRSGSCEWVALFPAALGFVFVGSAVFVPPWIGFGPFFTAVVCGQIGMSLVVDYTGIVWSCTAAGGPQGVKLPQGAGAVLVVVGTVLFQYETIRSGTGDLGAGAFVGLSGAGVLAGAALVVQAALNRRLGSSLGTPWRAIAFNFTTSATVITCVALMLQPSPSAETAVASDAWKFFGGVFGFCVVSVMVLVSGPDCIGSVITFSMQVLGQLASSVLVDLFVAPAVLGRPAIPFSGMKASGLSVVILGVLCGMLADPLLQLMTLCRSRKTRGSGKGKEGRKDLETGGQSVGDSLSGRRDERTVTQTGAEADYADLSVSMVSAGNSSETLREGLSMIEQGE
uniref:EamA domain-containing protein n=1 Tax=Chromera velia CCMP2878 TaxID=1169474 RepID=A0A0G4FTH4_9ALVE|eukprot:Cvel_3733.t1-p1 / transcript=Cvel_3733.t1 / gene=Cvel_3733 / organism=Chromera_velia_CCMP2878 / gene_product=hypothetical protein / transcript_product=hypothetical protein / location=Cvel_scaffold155:70906-72321(-) / protein_length=421 / sequence_SO=supercontig / SO=protein_coding / is_pseudo=false